MVVESASFMDSWVDRAAVPCFGVALFATLACSVVTERADLGSGAPPNVILLLADDLGWGDLRAYDPRSRIPTPNIDRLAREGMLFTDVHSPSSVCSPSRYGVMTGRYPWRVRASGRALRYFAPPMIEAGRLTLPELLRRGGYATAAIGKWHLGLNVPATGGGHVRGRGRLSAEPDFSAPIEGGPLDHGFDSYFGAQLDSVRAFVRDRRYVGLPLPVSAGNFQASGKYRVAGWREPRKGKIQLDEALDVVERLHAGVSGRPFFLYFATQYPHQPYSPAVSVAGTRVRGTSGAGPRGDLVVELDVVLGQLLERLEVLGIARETLIILTSDNGAVTAAGDGAAGHDPSGGWRGGKGSIWEGGHRVPFIARWGDGTEAGSTIRPGSASVRLIGLQDLMATVAELIGEPLAADVAEDSESFLPALAGEASPTREHLVHRSVAGQLAIRSGDWKLIQDGPHVSHRGVVIGPAGPRLYNLADDPGETIDLSARHAGVAARLAALLDTVTEDMAMVDGGR